MSNVKPGDLARVVADPDNQGTLGMQVLVVERADDTLLYVRIHRGQGRIAWKAQALETRKIRDSTRTTLVTAGTLLYSTDNVLKRIDPPADSLDLLREEPLPGELAVSEAAKNGCKLTIN